MSVFTALETRVAKNGIQRALEDSFDLGVSSGGLNYLCDQVSK